MDEEAHGALWPFFKSCQGCSSCKVGTSLHHQALPLIPKMTFASAHSYLKWTYTYRELSLKAYYEN